MKQHQLNCNNCNEIFVAKRNDAEYCSNACRQDAYLKRGTTRDLLQKEKTERQAADTLNIFLNQSLEIFKTWNGISKKGIGVMLGIISKAEQVFNDLPRHAAIKNEIKALYQWLLDLMNKKSMDEIVFDAGIREPFLKYLADVSTHLKSILV